MNLAPAPAPARASETATAVPTVPLLYINLDEDVERRRAFESAFATTGLAIERHTATRWTRLSPAEQAALHSPALNQMHYFRPLVAGECGCYASHIAVWRALLSGSAPALVVLEDDVRPEPGFAEAVQAIAALPSGWDMVKLIGRPRERPARRQPLSRRFELVTYRRVPSLTAGYAVSRSGAEKLLATRVPFYRPIDVDLRLWWESSLVMRGVLPAAIALAETELQSSVGERHGSAGWRQQWRKFVFKLRYSFANAAAREP